MEMQYPRHLNKPPNDSVTYFTSSTPGGPYQKHYEICYAKHMHSFDTTEILCVPRDDRNWKSFFVDAPIFLRFIDILKENRMIPENVHAYVDDGVPKMLIPKGSSRHRFYAALCAYRWADSFAHLAWLTVKLTDDMPHLSFWQILHYAMGTHATRVVHNFCYVITGTSKYNDHGTNFNLANSLAMPYFWYQPEDVLKKKTGDTCDELAKLSGELGSCILDKKTYFSKPTLLIPNGDNEFNVLNRCWTKLFQYAEVAGTCGWKPSKIRERLKEMYEEICTEHKEVNDFRNAK